MSADTFENKICAGFGIAAHPADGALIHVTQPIAMRVCRPCWRRWVDAQHDRKGHTHG